MRIPLSTLRFIAFGSILLTTACADWYAPESRSRGHIFDEASRGAPQFGVDDGERRLDIIIKREFPPGTPLANLIRHVEEAGGICSAAIMNVVDPDLKMTVCRYESITYFTFAFMGLGEPSLHEGTNTWTVAIFHSDGLIDGYDVRGRSLQTNISREEYMERLARQRADEKAQSEISGD